MLKYILTLLLSLFRKKDTTMEELINPTIIVQRQKLTEDGIFGLLTLTFDPFTCFTVENRGKSILSGTYNVIWYDSPKFQRKVPQILVPERENIEIHPANFPKELEGCVAVGDKLDGDAVLDSKDTYAKLLKILLPYKTFQIEVKDIAV